MKKKREEALEVNGEVVKPDKEQIAITAAGEKASCEAEDQGGKDTGNSAERQEAGSSADDT